MSQSIMILGGTGFLGSVLTNKFLCEGYNVFILTRDTKVRSKVLRHKALNYYDLDAVLKPDFFDKKNIGSVINTIANYGRDGETKTDIIQANYSVPRKIFELCLAKKVRCFINTDTFYNTKMNLSPPLSLYVNNKKKFVRYAREVASDQTTKFINLEIHHMYGPNDRSTKFIPYLVKSFKENIKSLDLSNCVEKRDFIHVKDVAQAIFQVTQDCNSLPGQIEIGCGIATELKEIVRKLKHLCNADTKLNFGAISSHDTGSYKNKADISILQNIGWAPNFDIETGFSDCV
ncbi:NAD-dependent epimerase/dehydratase family protein [Paracoccaceae bacterium]|nr:NAD-dependent epimerase/dehydratase family protein [Paracoccaceae bacterium]